MQSTKASGQHATIPVSKLDLDVENPRLGTALQQQQEALEAIVSRNPSHFLVLARSIVERGLDPLTRFAVLRSADRYKVLEGNRRTAALKALESPGRVEHLLSTAEKKTLTDLAMRLASSPIREVDAWIVDQEATSAEWITLRHTGVNEGAGVVPWDREDQKRYLARYGKTLPLSAQVLQFLRDRGVDTSVSSDRAKGFTSTLDRVLNTPEVRARLGIGRLDGQLVATVELEAATKSLTYLVDQLRTGKVNVDRVKSLAQRQDYARKLPAAHMPRANQTIDEPILLHGESAPSAVDGAARTTRSVPARRTPPSASRKSLIPRTTILRIKPARIERVYGELRKANLEDLRNLCAVGLRVFLELSVDHYLLENGTLVENEKLAVRLKRVISAMESAGGINRKQAKALTSMADKRNDILGLSLFRLHEFVHNPYDEPMPRELITTWDVLEPLMLALWP